MTLTDDDRDLARELDERIYEFNVAATGLADGRGLSIRVHDDAGGLVAGLTGWTWGGCGYVDVLWVAEHRRGDGIGSLLLDSAEAEARSRGCRLMALSTHSFQAPEFYRRRGYAVTGRTDGYPQGHAQLHLSKPLD
jgi:GNAT superfamily N-acetyltransferase